MGRDKTAEARLGGMDYALRQIKENGVEAFEKELVWRNRNNIDLPISEKDLIRSSDGIRKSTLRFVLTMVIAILHDEYDFGTEECNRFRNRFNLRVNCMNDQMVTLDDYADMIKDELDIDVGIVD